MAYNVGMPGPGASDDRFTSTADERRLDLETVFRDYAPRVFNYARHRGATISEAEDVVSEVFIVLTRRLGEAPADVLPWLYGVARKVHGNQVRGKRRRLALARRVEEEVSWLHHGGTDSSSAGTGDVVIERALSMLSTKDREVLLLVAWDDLSYEQAAQSLGCTSAAFAQMLRRARRRMLQAIDEVRATEITESDPTDSREA
jgi:RNA polymerase sigma-70 factor (ECF subfamily)